MIPTTEEVLAQLVLLWRLVEETEPVAAQTAGALASELMYPPLFIINALDLGKDLGVLTHDYETDEVVVTSDWVGRGMGSEVTRLMAALEDKVRYENALESDLNLGLLQSWCMGVRPSALRLALAELVRTNVLYEYELADPLDKDSVYQFYTHVDNKGKDWGLKQFKHKREKKK